MESWCVLLRQCWIKDDHKVMMHSLLMLSIRPMSKRKMDPPPGHLRCILMSRASESIGSVLGMSQLWKKHVSHRENGLRMVPISRNHVYALHTIWPSYLLASIRPYPIKEFKHNFLKMRVGGRRSFGIFPRVHPIWRSKYEYWSTCDMTQHNYFDEST